MATVQKLFVFNRFPVNKKNFFEFVERLCEYREFNYLFLNQPRRLDKVYVTMTEKEVAALAKRFETPSIVERLNCDDGIYCGNLKIAIVHVPGLVRSMSAFNILPEDYQRRGVFACCFFSCLFHELSHANEERRISINSLFAKTPAQKDAIKDSIERFEKTAVKDEIRCLQLLSKYLEDNNVSWFQIVDRIFDWNRLQRHIPDKAKGAIQS